MSIIDAHAHIASWPSVEESKAYLLHGMEKHGIAFSLVSNADASTYPTVPTPLDREKDSLTCLKEVIEFAKQNPGRIGAAIWIRPEREPSPSEELERFIQENRSLIHAYKIHPFCERVELDGKALDPYLESARKFDLPVLVHTAYDPYSGIGRMVNLAKRYPDLVFIAAHLELCTDHDYAIEALKEVPNVYADTAWVPMDKAVKAMSVIGKHRILFGTDAPLDGQDTLDNVLYWDYFENRLGLSEEDYRLLMEENARKIYRIS